jgi:hypothetical protein
VILASVHLALWQSLVPAVVIGVWASWYWCRQGRSQVPPSRRFIRRTSMLFILLSLPAFVRGLSVIDAQTDGGMYVQTWIIAIVLVSMVAITALIDAINSVRLHAADRAEEALEATADLGVAMRKATGQNAGDQAPPTESPS